MIRNGVAGRSKSAPALTLGAAHQSLREQVRDLVRERIFGGQLEPGERIVERVLAEELGVSRVPVREALNLLKGEGLVHDVPRRGVIVTKLGLVSIQELFEVREALEVKAAELASDRATGGELAALRVVVERGEAAVERGDLAGVSSANQEFHDALPLLAHNAMLASTIEPLESRLHWLIRQNRSPEVFVPEHIALFEAIASRNPRRAGASAARHIRTSRELCLELLFSTQA